MSPLCCRLPSCCFVASTAGARRRRRIQARDREPQVRARPSSTVPAGKKIKLVVENRDATPEEFESHALNREKVIAGKSTATIFIGPLKPGSYPFVGEYNEKTAKGVIVAK